MKTNTLFSVLDIQEPVQGFAEYPGHKGFEGMVERFLPERSD